MYGAWRTSGEAKKVKDPVLELKPSVLISNRVEGERVWSIDKHKSRVDNYKKPAPWVWRVCTQCSGIDDPCKQILT